ncbi:chemotaxis protein CheB [Ramlibacter sp. G-1-2-2]|uniref:protein-glutamate methylesterase n=1 Tax=Ramlibacter agri TaxID=2728837 RepID=A0A848H3Q6_9BURK|nr:chemotaxis protein CheB [Ramlibacter agri]NML45204.1 chemotaxis protein CheB [Ramlibacter agri]
MVPAAPPAYLVVVGASAGGVSTLLQLAGSLPRGFPAPVCVVQHVGANISILPALVQARGPLPAVHAHDGQRLEPGKIFIAPPDCHMLVIGDTIRLTRGPRENYTRPAIDPLFRSAALHWGPHAIGVILTGLLDDGTAGLGAIKRRGGVTVVEDPATACEPSMPLSALQHVEVDHCLPVAGIGPLLASLVQYEAPREAPRDVALEREVAINLGANLMENLASIATPSSLTCPDCGGALWEVEDVQPLRYRCHTGHAFSARSLEHAQAEAGEHALRGSVRALQEREILLRRMATVALGTGDQRQADAALRRAEQLREQVRLLLTFTETVGAEGEEPAAADQPEPR